MKCCDECGATSFLNIVGDRLICEKCMIWYDYDEELEEDCEDDGGDDDYWARAKETKRKSVLVGVGQKRLKKTDSISYRGIREIGEQANRKMFI